MASSLAARRTSVASSVTLRATASTPPSRSDVVYEPAGRSAARASIVAQRSSSQAKPWLVRSAGAPSRSKQLRVPRWQVGPVGSTVTRSASPSQSAARPTSRRTLPLVSPLRHRRSREREWKWTSPLAMVAASASASMWATIRTRPSWTSWTTAVTSPSGPNVTAGAGPVMPRPPEPVGPACPPRPSPP